MAHRADCALTGDNSQDLHLLCNLGRVPALGRAELADLAQLVEQRIRNAQVTCSSHVIGSKNNAIAPVRRRGRGLCPDARKPTPFGAGCHSMGPRDRWTVPAAYSIGKLHKDGRFDRIEQPKNSGCDGH